MFHSEFIENEISVSYKAIAHPICATDISFHESQGFVNPFPFFKWCALASKSSGAAPRGAGIVMVQAYRAAAMPPLLDIVLVRVVNFT